MSDDRELRRLFDHLRTLEEEAPPFRKAWLAARERQRAHSAGAGRRRLLRSAAALSAAAALVVVLWPAPGPREPAPPFEAEALARSLSEWEAPLDFLLEAPESYMFAPEIEWPRVPAEATTLQMEELL